MFSKGDFLRMGIGIKARHARCQLWWEPHLRCSREFIQRSLKPGNTVAVFGAGRLLDVDIFNLAARFQRIYLFDADPACLPYWRGILGREVRGKITARIEDVTETMKAWTSQLGRVHRGDQLSDFLSSLEAPLPQWSSEHFDAVISLNLLGQIPLYWRDRVLLARKRLSEVEWSALQNSMGKLQAAHLYGLMTVPATQKVLLTDTEYYFYHVDQSDWRIEAALVGDGLNVFHEVRKSSSVVNTETWLWHLAPQFVESDDDGKIHRVEAIALGPRCVKVAVGSGGTP